MLGHNGFLIDSDGLLRLTEKNVRKISKCLSEFHFDGRLKDVTCFGPHAYAHFSFEALKLVEININTSQGFINGSIN